MSTSLTLPTELTIYTVGELRSTWLAALAAPAKPARRKKAADAATLVMAASAVEQVDAAGVQCLLALQHHLAARQTRLQLLDPSDPLREACTALGATHLMGGVQ